MSPSVSAMEGEKMMLRWSPQIHFRFAVMFTPKPRVWRHELTNQSIAAAFGGALCGFPRWNPKSGIHRLSKASSRVALTFHEVKINDLILLLEVFLLKILSGYCSDFLWGKGPWSDFARTFRWCTVSLSEVVVVVVDFLFCFFDVVVGACKHLVHRAVPEERNSRGR